MGAWVKLFEDGTFESGTDAQIDARTASWSQGKLSDIKEVKLFDGGFVALLNVSNSDEWHQFDRFIAHIQPGNHVISSTRVGRFIQTRLNQQHLDKFLVFAKEKPEVFAVRLRNKPDMKATGNYKIKEKDIGKWVTLFMDSSGAYSLYFSERGKFNGYQQISR